MTREEFFENITTWAELIEFCHDNGCEQFVDSIYSDEARNDEINEEIVEWAREYPWIEMRDILNDIEVGYDYWEKDDWGDWAGLEDDDDYFSDRMDDVAAWCDEGGIWDTEDEDEFAVQTWRVVPEHFGTDPEDQLPVEDEDCSLDELFCAGISCIETLVEAEKSMETDIQRDFDALFSAV